MKCNAPVGKGSWRGRQNQETPSFEPHNQPTARLFMEEKVYKPRSAYLGRGEISRLQARSFSQLRELCVRLPAVSRVFVIIITGCNNRYSPLLFFHLCFFLVPTISTMYTPTRLQPVFSPPNDVSVQKPSRHTSLDTDSLRAYRRCSPRNGQQFG